MRKQMNLLDVRVRGNLVDEAFECVARIIRAFAIVGIGAQADIAPRRPGEQDRDGFRLRIVDNLREPVHRIVEAIVEAMDEDQNAGLPGPARGVGDRGGKRLVVDVIGRDRHEVALRIAGQGARPLHGADLAVRRNRDRDRRIGQGVGALAAKHLAGIFNSLLARGRDQERNARGPLDLLLHGNEDALRGPV
jgi:hypothetical protein